MRFNSANFLLGLIALNVPETLGRALPNNAVDIYKENLARAAPIRITPAKEVPVVKPAGTTTNTGTKTGEDTTTARIGATDKTPDTSTSGSTTRIGTVDSNDATLWCRGGGCGGQTETTLLTTAELTTRGNKGLDLVAAPAKGPDYTARESANYKIKKATSDTFKDENGVEDSIPTLEFDKKYGFQAEDGWQRMEVHSGNPHEAVLTTSVGRTTKDGKDYVAIVAHTRFARADSNRFKLTAEGDQIKGADGKFLVADDAGTKAVPVAQLMHDAAKQSGKLDGTKPEKIFLVSENVVNDEAVRDIVAAHKALNTVGKSNVMNKGATGAEGDWFKILAGNDNNYSWLNTVGRNPDTFKDYEIVSIETRDVREKTMAITLGKKA